MKKLIDKTTINFFSKKERINKNQPSFVFHQFKELIRRNLQVPVRLYHL